MPEGHLALVERLFDAFNRRDFRAIAAICDEGVEFSSSADGVFGRSAPYFGPTGLRDYVADAGRTWEELLMTPCEIERRGDLLLVHGRVYVRSRELGIRDMPVAWIWELRDGRFVRGEVFPDPREAMARFAGMPA
jgi:ketosteroid isomerase-like protein